MSDSVPWFVRLPIGLCLMLAFLTPVPASAQYFGRNKVQYEEFDFKVLATPHFDIHYYSSEADAAAEVARMAERWHTRLSKVLAHDLTGRQVVVLYVTYLVGVLFFFAGYGLKVTRDLGVGQRVRAGS